MGISIRFIIAMVLGIVGLASCGGPSGPSGPYVHEVRGDFVSVVWPTANQEVAHQARAVAADYCHQTNRDAVFLNVTTLEGDLSERRLAWYRCR